MRRQRRRTGLGITVLTALALTALLGACSGGGGGSQVATLGGDSAAGASDSGSGSDHEPTEAETQEAFRKFAQCMREHGIDMPDPQFDENGGVMINGGATEKSAEQGPEQFEAADKACQKHLKGVVDARRKNIDPEQQQKMQEQALAFAKCMREHGIDMPDPQFEGDGGKFSIAIGSPDGGGLDPNDPTFQEAQEACAKEAGMDLPGGGKAGPGRGGFSVGTKDAQ